MPPSLPSATPAEWWQKRQLDGAFAIAAEWQGSGSWQFHVASTHRVSPMDKCLAELRRVCGLHAAAPRRQRRKNDEPLCSEWGEEVHLLVDGITIPAVALQPGIEVDERSWD